MMNEFPNFRILNPSDSYMIQDKMDSFFIEKKIFIENKYKLDPSKFQISSGELAHDSGQITDDRVTYLSYKDTILACVFDTRTEFNYEIFASFNNLDQLKDLDLDLENSSHRTKDGLKNFEFDNNANILNSTNITTLKNIIHDYLQETKEIAIRDYIQDNPFFEKKYRNISYDSKTICSDKVSYLVCRDRILAGVFETQTLSNEKKYTFFRNLNMLKYLK